MSIIKKNEILNYLKQVNNFNSYIKFKQQQKNNNYYSPDKNGKKYLVIMACHCNTKLKLETIRGNLKFFAFENIDKIIINTSELPYRNELYNICGKYNNAKYCEMSNTSYYDFGKWLHVLNNEVNYNEYDYIMLTNDSFIIHNSINHFFNLIYKYNVELYGYNDSTQTRYHYQSYLFCLRKDAVKIFIDKISNPSLTIKTQNDIINNFEITMTDWFSTKKSFLQIGNFGIQKHENIFFTNDTFYLPLKKTGLLPFTKIKRITGCL